MEASGLRIGQGYDVHRLVPGRRLVLGGEEFDHPSGLDGHSDADVVLHALGDALLGACALGDLGDHFPPGDPRWKDADMADEFVRRGVGFLERHKAGAAAAPDRPFFLYFATHDIHVPRVPHPRFAGRQPDALRRSSRSAPEAEPRGDSLSWPRLGRC